MSLKHYVQLQRIVKVINCVYENFRKLLKYIDIFLKLVKAFVFISHKIVGQTLNFMESSLKDKIKPPSPRVLTAIIQRFLWVLRKAQF